MESETLEFSQRKLLRTREKAEKMQERMEIGNGREKKISRIKVANGDILSLTKTERSY